jgi:hypothetical protein
MGTDFLRNKRERHTKSWRFGLQFAAVDMFAPVKKVKRVVRATSDSDAKLCLQQDVMLRLLPGEKVVASDGVHQVATVDKPPKALLTQLKQQHNAARGTVYRLHEGSCSLELLLED